MDMTTPQDRRKHKAIQELVASHASLMIADMDPHTLMDLVEYLQAIERAKKDNDQDQIQYIRDAIEELFIVDCDDGELDIDAWEERLMSDERSSPAIEGARAADHAFMARYAQAKSDAGVRTQREVAKRCKLAVNTVNAIETQRVRPQSRTVQRLADGLNVSVEWLLNGTDSK